MRNFVDFIKISFYSSRLVSALLNEPYTIYSLLVARIIFAKKSLRLEK